MSLSTETNCGKKIKKSCKVIVIEPKDYVHFEQNVIHLRLFQSKNTLSKRFKKTKRMIAKREFSPAFVIVIFVAVAALGGGMNFVLSQGYLNSVEASNLYGVETLLFLGYDATDNDAIVYHDGLKSNSQAYWHGNKSEDGIKHGERIGVYVKNTSSQKITLKTLMLADSVYSFQHMGPRYTMTPYSMTSPLDNKEYTIVTNGNRNAPADTITGNSPEIMPGQSVTLVIELDQNFNVDRDMHLKITTKKGNDFVYTVVSGQSK
ncbi:MAG: hypothetical protein H2B00_04665 [Nitrosopumilaceae archaeon]|uniref:Uncharacterized protein n=2 Tax=Candidatus Nitrosomaritimum aestuariumsis TaxID=3342354 RepID=A0AC60WA22_9ARCH|nr:hypothetical protein [Nitrosopumilaceae archaeon]MBA4463751.1 hypothetical protein [Nitrosopumilaceae archaeon]